MQGSSSSSCVNKHSLAAAPVPGADGPPAARRIVAAHRLPLRALPDPESPFGFAFSLDPDAPSLQLSRGFSPAPVIYIGTLPASAESKIAPSNDLDDYLMENFSCLPVHLDAARHAKFYDGFCKRYLWPLLHYLLPFTVADAGNLYFDIAEHRAFIAANRQFADRVIQVLSPDDGDLVIVHDYHLWALPTFLRRKCPRAGVGLFLHTPFPPAEILDSALLLVGFGLGLGYRAFALRLRFQVLTASHVRPSYRTAARRLILLDYDGTMVPELEDERKREPDDGILRLLDELCADPKNVVFLVSSRGKDQLAAWFDPCEKLGICAEHGYFTRWSKDDPWEVMSNKQVVAAGTGSGWKAVAEQAMRQYTEATAGSYMETKETALAWHYQNADPVVGPCQANELHDHLVGVLADEPAAVAIDSQTVEVNPQGVNKGVAVQGVLSAMARRGVAAPDLALCFGDGEADEAMFEALARSDSRLAAGARVVACTVGKKATEAAFYVEEPADVVDLLRALALI